jgi:serine/threonine-protein kinase HipA
MSMNGKRDNFTPDDFVATAKTAAMQRGRAPEIVAEVAASIARWPEFAAEAKVTDSQTAQIRAQLRLDLAR